MTFLDDLRAGGMHTWDLANLYVRHPRNEVAYYNLLFAVAVAARPRLVLELGTGPGVSSLAFLRALQYWNARRPSEQGVLHTCDINANAIRRLARFGKLVVPHLKATDRLAEEWGADPRLVDLLYIDADHSYEQSLKDFENFCSFVVPNGLILLHDTFPLTKAHEQPRYSGSVWRTARAIKDRHRDDYESMTFPHLNGVTLVRRRGADYF